MGACVLPVGDMDTDSHWEESEINKCQKGDRKIDAGNHTNKYDKL